MHWDIIISSSDMVTTHHCLGPCLTVGRMAVTLVFELSRLRSLLWTCSALKLGDTTFGASKLGRIRPGEVLRDPHGLAADGSLTTWLCPASPGSGFPAEGGLSSPSRLSR